MLILLDIDGVLVPAKSWSPPPYANDGFYMFNKKSVEALNLIIVRSKASIVLTTSHKHSFTLEKWTSLLESRGVIVNGLKRLKENTNHLTRQEEINNWYSSGENVQEFVIIDDDKTLNNLPVHLKSRLVQTKPLIGLTSMHVEDAIEKLRAPLELV